ncbi:MAG: hypothetical protein KGZ65_02585 [Sphingomonadales bacterium]|nr:hypothetical protein [Sphingomonadaceae bacterium]MBS3930092.1 hypothetical protein [Sphingomonadales bacterium]
MDRDPYTQCLVVKHNLSRVAWLPAKLSTVGQALRFKRDDGSWDDGWKVLAAYQTLPEYQIPEGRLTKACKRR